MPWSDLKKLVLDANLETDLSLQQPRQNTWIEIVKISPRYKGTPEARSETPTRAKTAMDDGDSSERK